MERVIISVNDVRTKLEDFKLRLAKKHGLKVFYSNRAKKKKKKEDDDDEGGE